MKDEVQRVCEDFRRTNEFDLMLVPAKVRWTLNGWMMSPAQGLEMDIDCKLPGSGLKPLYEQLCSKS